MYRPIDVYGCQTCRLSLWTMASRSPAALAPAPADGASKLDGHRRQRAHAIGIRGAAPEARRLALDRQEHVYDGPRAGSALDPQAATVGVDDARHDRETEPGAAR